MNYLMGLVAPKVEQFARQKIGDQVDAASKDLGVLSEAQYAVMVQIHGFVQNHQLVQAREALNTLAEHITAREYIDLRGLIDADDAGPVQEWVQAKRDYAGTAGLVKKAATTFMTTISDTAKKHLGAWYENFRAPAPELDAFGELLGNIAQPQAVAQERSAEEVEQAITEQREFLVRSGTLMATTKAVLGWACGIQNLDNDTVINLLESVHHQTGDVFRQTLFQQIDSADNVSFFRKLWAKACYYVMTPVIGFYVEHFTLNVLNYMRAHMAEFYNGHFTTALNGSVGFLNDQMQTIYGAYERAAAAPDRNAAIDPLIGRDLARPIHNGDMARADLHVRIAHEAVERFAPVSSLRSRVAEALDIQIPEDSNWAWMNWPIAAATGLVSIVVVPVLYLIEAAGNAIAKASLKKLAVDLELVPTLLASTGQALGVGNEYKHAMNQLLVQQLEKAHALMIAPGEDDGSIDLAQFERGLPDETRNQLKTLVSSLFLDLGCALHSDTPAALTAYLEAQKTQAMPESLKSLLEALGIPIDIQAEAKETTVRYLALLLSTVLKQDTLQELTLTSLTTLNRSCFTHDEARPTEEEMRATEARRDKLLNDIITIAIRKAVNDKFYPMKRIQKEADQFVLRLHAEVTEFDKAMKQLQGEGRFAEMVTTFRQFVLNRDKALSSQQGSANVNNHSLTNFNAISRAFAAKMKPMQPHLAALSKAEQAKALATTEHGALEKLQQVFARLNEDHSEQNARDVTLEMMRHAQTDQFRLLEGSADLRDILPTMRQRFGQLRQTFNDWQSADEAVAVATLLQTAIADGAPRQQLLQVVNSFNFVSPLAETLKQALNTQIRNGTLDDAAVAKMIDDNGKIIERCQQQLQQQKTYAETLAPLDQQREEAIQKADTEIHDHNEQMNQHLKALTDWSGTEEALRSQITAMAAPADDDAEEAAWNAEEGLAPFKCQNTFALDLTAFADTVQEFVVRQIAAYTNAIPLLLSKGFNYESSIHRLMVAFVNERQPPAALVH